GACMVLGGIVLTWRAPTWVQWWHRAGWVLVGVLLLTVPLAAPTPYGTRLAPYVRRLAEHADLVVLGLVALCGVCLLGAAISHHLDARHDRRDAVEAGEPARATRLAPVTTAGLVAVAGVATTALLVAVTSGFGNRLPEPVGDRADRLATSDPGRSLFSALDVTAGEIVVTALALLVATAAAAVTAAAVQQYRRRRARRRYREQMDYFEQRIELEQARVMGEVRDALQTVSTRS
ncbi:MAG: hypothetical protein ACRCSN_10935, partial [Dermatophilaceae bacterium]